ncbi:hemin uptake protein HemP [Falsochrobactrum ovis]
MQVNLPRERSEIGTVKWSGGSDEGEGRVHNSQVSLKTVNSSDLFKGSREVAIEHAGALYRLKITRQGKLILNK